MSKVTRKELEAVTSNQALITDLLERPLRAVQILKYRRVGKKTLLKLHELGVVEGFAEALEEEKRKSKERMEYNRRAPIRKAQKRLKEIERMQEDLRKRAEELRQEERKLRLYLLEEEIEGLASEPDIEECPDCGREIFNFCHRHRCPEKQCGAFRIKQNQDHG